MKRQAELMSVFGRSCTLLLTPAVTNVKDLPRPSVESAREYFWVSFLIRRTSLWELEIKKHQVSSGKEPRRHPLPIFWWVLLSPFF